MSCAVTRSRVPARRTLPARTVATLSFSPTSRTSASLPLKAKAEVRAATRRPSTLLSALISSSVMPSEKYSFSRSALMFTNGSTAIDVGVPALACTEVLPSALLGGLRPTCRSAMPARPA